MKVLVSIPAYNEEKSIGEVINDIKRELQGKYDFKIQVIDDGSTDKTAEVARKAGAYVFSHQINMGLAETFKTEIQQALKKKFDVMVITDADGQYLARDIPRLLKEIEKGYDLVLGSRFMGTIEEMPFLKKLGNRLFTKVISKITNFKLTDCQTGFRAFTREVAEKIQITSTYTYTQEQIIRAIKAKFKIKEIPIYFAKRHGKSRLMRNPFEFAFKAGINLLRVYRDYEPLKFFGFWGGFFFLIGFFIGIWLIYLFLTTGKVGRIPSTIACMLFITIGLQIWLFGFMADMNKKD